MTPTRMSAWLDQVWLIRYLDRQLAGEEAQWFEVHAMDRPVLLARIEADTRLRDALAAAASTWHSDVSVDGGGRPGGAPDRDANGGGSASAGSRSAKHISQARDSATSIPAGRDPQRLLRGGRPFMHPFFRTGVRTIERLPPASPAVPH